MNCLHQSGLQHLVRAQPLNLILQMQVWKKWWGQSKANKGILNLLSLLLFLVVILIKIIFL